MTISRVDGPLLNEILEEIEVVEHHIHTVQVCYGNGAGGFLEDGKLTPFRFTTAADGSFTASPLQIYNGALGSGFLLDLDEIFVTEFQRADVTYLVEFWAGSTTFGAATRLVSCYLRTSSLTFESMPHQAKSPRVRGELKIWGRVKSSYGDGVGSYQTATGFATVDGIWDEAITSHLIPGSTGEALSDAGGGSSPSDIATAVMASIVEGTISVQQAVRAVLAVVLGKSVQDYGRPVKFAYRDTSDIKDRVVVTFDNEDRVQIDLDLT